MIAAAMVATAFGASAQEASRTGYFTEGYTFRHELNPAFGGEYNYVSIPALGNLNVSLMSNVGVNTFLYKLPDGRLTTFMSPSVDAQTFLKKIHNSNKANMNLNEVLLSGGWKAWGGFNTVTISARADAGVNLPKDLLRFMKLGQVGEATDYSFKNLRVDASAMAEVALGHSRQILPELRVGAKLNLLFGVANASARIDRMDIHMGTDSWQVSAQGSMNLAAGSGLYVPTKAEAGKHYDTPDMADLVEWGDIDYSFKGLSGFGMTLDLGATYDMSRFVDGLEVSAAILDLGFMSWSNNIKGRTADTQWSFDGFHNVALDSDQPDYDDKKLGQQFDDMWDDLQDCVNMHRVEGKGSRVTAPAATITLGANYKMPFYKKLTGGFLFTQHCHSTFSWTEGRFTATVAPVKCFNAAISYAASTYGSSFGWLINVRPRGINFFLGSDHQFFRITPQVIPVGKSSANFTLGLSATF